MLIEGFRDDKFKRAVSSWGLRRKVSQEDRSNFFRMKEITSLGC